MGAEFDSSPDNEIDIDREIRIEKMKRELEDLSGGSIISGAFEEVSPELEELFLTRACEFEKAPLDTYFNRLLRRGLQMLPPSELDDISISTHLSEVITVLASLSCYLYDTDHLSDRELYTWLWTEGLREETPDLSQLGGAWHTSPIGSGSEEDIAIHLRYYASEKERLRWQKEFPSDPLPPHSPRPYDRDRHLPHSD